MPFILPSVESLVSPIFTLGVSGAFGVIVSIPSIGTPDVFNSAKVSGEIVATPSTCVGIVSPSKNSQCLPAVVGIILPSSPSHIVSDGVLPVISVVPSSEYATVRPFGRVISLPPIKVLLGTSTLGVGLGLDDGVAEGVGCVSTGSIAALAFGVPKLLFHIS